MASRNKTSGGVGTNQHQVQGRAVDRHAAAAGRARANDLDDTNGFTFNGDLDDTTQVADHLDEYSASIQTQVAADPAFRPYVDKMRGHIPGIAGDDEDIALRLLGKAWNAEWDRRGRELAEANYDDYQAVHDQIVADGGYPYNDSFRGRIPGLTGQTDRRPGVQGDMEDHAIYVMQGMRHVRETNAQVDAFIGEGAEPIDAVDGSEHFKKVMCYGFYMGGTGVRVYENVTVKSSPGGHIIVPKGKRRGDAATGTVLGLR